MTRYGIDAPTALQLARDGIEPSREHQLVAPNLLRSQALSMLYREVRRGDLSETEARRLLDRITTMHMRLLGDRVSRATAWTIATQLGWPDTYAAEYLAVAKLQADRFITVDTELREAARAVVPTGTIEELYS